MKRLKHQNLVIAVLSVLVMVLLFVTIYQNFFLNLNDKPPLENPTKDLVVKSEEYTVFDLEDVPFKFVVATIQFSSNEAINIELANFSTNENVVLNSVDQYRKALEAKGYDLSLMEVNQSDLVSLENNLQVNLFIPVKSLNVDEVQLILSDTFQESLKLSIDPITFDLSNPKGTPEMLGKLPSEEPDPDDIDEEPVEPIVFGELTEIDSEAIYFENEDGQLQPMDYPSVIRIYSSYVSISSESKTGIQEARLVVDSTNEVFSAIGPEYVYQFGNNIIGDYDFFFEGHLLFEVSSVNPYLLADNVPITIEYKLIGQDEWITVSE